ncbi:MAG: YidC/Oxa1 family membrane protein insertase [Chloroflexota bacterium]|nr:YidC/Oxa1 family membrane protein insertase [Chloroflexota bacterium]
MARLDLMLAILLALVAFVVIAAPVLGADPSAGASASPAASGSPDASGATSPAPSPAGSSSAAPCPLPNPLPTAQPGQSPLPNNLCPAVLNGADPLSLLAWIFTPIFQAIFMLMALLYNIFRDIGLAIIVLTILLRVLLIPVFRKQIVSQRRTQMLQPELRAIQAKYKGNRAKISEEQMRLYRERGINPAAGCLPALLQLVLLIPMYQVISQGLAAPDISSMLQIAGNPVLSVTCQDPGNTTIPCVDPTIPWLDWLTPAAGGLDAHVPEILFMVIPGIFGLSVLALISAFLQLIQTRMMIPVNTTNDPQIRMQQRIFLILPLFSLFYGWILPAGLFLYWITTTLFSIVQQYLIAGWGGLFPLFGWTPRFAVDHQPRFPVPSYTPPVENGPGSESPATRRSPTDRAAGTIRPARSKARTSRRGRRR